jgi:hypothetical protein
MMTIHSNSITLLCLVVAVLSRASAFVPAHQQAARPSTTVNMAPKFDPSAQKWIPQNDDEANPAYGPVGKLYYRG